MEGVTPDTLRVVGFSRPPALVAATRDGFFAAESIELSHAHTRGSAPQIAALLAGEYDLAHTAVDNVVLRVDRDNADLVVVLVAELGVSQQLVVQRDVAKGADLRGRMVGVDAVDSGYATLLYGLLERRGVPRDAYEVVSVGGTSERADAIIAGTIAGAMLGPPHDRRAVESGARVLASAAADYPGYPSLSVAARRSWAAANRELVARYARALLAAERWAADPANRDRAIELLMADAGGSREDAVALYEAERRTREVAAPSVDEQRDAVARVARLRHPGETVDVSRYFEPRA